MEPNLGGKFIFVLICVKSAQKQFFCLFFQKFLLPKMLSANQIAGFPEVQFPEKERRYETGFLLLLFVVLCCWYMLFLYCWCILFYMLLVYVVLYVAGICCWYMLFYILLAGVYRTIKLIQIFQMSIAKHVQTAISQI